MIEIDRARAIFEAEGLHAWAGQIVQQLEQVLHRAPHGDWGHWTKALEQLPMPDGGSVDWSDGALDIQPRPQLSEPQRTAMLDGLRALHPWRKGPYRIADIRIDTEWRSDWKWDRLLPHLQPLSGHLVLDVGCGNGYHCWRMAQAGARRVIGIDPTAVFFAQFLAIRKLLKQTAPDLAAKVEFVPLGIESLPADLACFDSVFSMGVLYHRRSPLDHLLELRGALRAGGQLVLETLVIEGDKEQVLVPSGRYAKMRNVWFIPTPGMLHIWLSRCGLKKIRTVDVTSTTFEEQRSTEWMRFESLADFLDPADKRLTIEGYPAPRRAVVIAEA